MTGLKSNDLLELEFISDPRVAPGGESIATVVSRIEKEEDEPPRYRSGIRLFDTNGGSRQAAEPVYSDSKPRFSPDGRSLAFLRKSGKEDPAQLFLLGLPNGEPRPLTEEAGGVEAFDWHPASTSLAYLAKARAKGSAAPVSREIERLRYRFDGKGYLPVEPRKLRLVETAGTTHELDHGGLDFEDLVWSKDGNYLVLVAALDRAELDEELRRLWRLEPQGAGPLALTSAMRLSGPSPGPDGRIAFLAPAVPEKTAGPSAVWLVSATGGDERALSGEEFDLSPATGGDCRYGDYPNRPTWLADDELMVNLNSRGRSSLARLAAEGGEPRPLDDTEAVVTAFDSCGGTVAYIEESSSHPGELCIRVGEEAPLRPPGFNRDVIERGRFSPAQGPFSPEGTGDAEYWRIDPREPRGDRALVIQVHGGPHTNAGHGFYFEYQLLAARGFTVLYGNPRGSSSYGQEHANAILGSYGTIDADDVLAFVDHALAAHPDPEAPVHLTGGSYGGFMTNWLVAHTGRFKSAVTQRSICNFLSFYGTSDIGWWFSERELGGNPWDDFERLWQQSPLRLAHRITTPLLILHSESDLRCPVDQAQQLFVALKRSGVADTKLVLFPDENHELSRSGRPDRRLARLDAIVEWFEHHA